MKKIYYIILLCLLTVTFSCNKEDDLEPTDMRYDYFTVSPDANDEESLLRRKFYEDHNIHLLFNDTLRHEQRGTYADGTPHWFTELLDLSYDITTTKNETRFTYIRDYQKQEEGIRYAETYILPHLGEGLRPYSIFLVETLEEDDWGWKNIFYYNGKRCLALATQGIAGMEEEELKERCIDIFYNIVYNKTNYYDEELNEFMALGNNLHGETLESAGLSDDPTNEEIYALGFLTWSTWYQEFPSRSSDFTSFLKAVFYQKEEDFKARYASYPLILQKYDIMKEVVKQKGYIF